MPGDEDRNGGTRSAHGPIDGNGQLNTNTTDKAKTSSTEGEVRAVLVSFQSAVVILQMFSRLTCTCNSATPQTLPSQRTTNTLRPSVQSAKCDSVMPTPRNSPFHSQLNQLKWGRERRNSGPSQWPTRGRSNIRTTLAKTKLTQWSGFKCNRSDRAVDLLRGKRAVLVLKDTPSVSKCQARSKLFFYTTDDAPSRTSQTLRGPISRASMHRPTQTAAHSRLEGQRLIAPATPPVLLALLKPNATTWHRPPSTRPS
jgi:hypothetical protein